MATSALVERDLESGRKVVAALALARIPVTVALWARIAESEEWGLFIATPLVDSKGPRAAYDDVLRALQVHRVYSDVPWMRLFVTSPQDPVLKSLQKNRRTVPLESFAAINADIGSRFVEDAYVYSGSIHIVEIQRAAPGRSAKYHVVYAPYSGPGGASRPAPVEGREPLQEFLRKKVRIEPEDVAQAMAHLDRESWASVPNVSLKHNDLKRLNLI